MLIVEGEKAADAAQKLLPEYNVISWMGGAAAYARTDWSCLKDKNVTIWPDHDAAGNDAAKGIQTILKEQHNTNALIVTIPHSFPEKWDLADQLPAGYEMGDIKCLLSPPHEQLKSTDYNQSMLYLITVTKGNEIAANYLLEKIQNSRASNREITNLEFIGLTKALDHIASRVNTLDESIKEEQINHQPSLEEIIQTHQKHEQLALIEARHIGSFYRYNHREPEAHELQEIADKSLSEYNKSESRIPEIKEFLTIKGLTDDTLSDLIALRAIAYEQRTGNAFTEQQLPALHARANYELARQKSAPELNPYQIKSEGDLIEHYWHYHGESPKEHYLARFEMIASKKAQEIITSLTQQHHSITFDQEIQNKNYEQLYPQLLSEIQNQKPSRASAQASMTAMYLCEAQTIKGRDLTNSESEALKIYVNHYFNCLNDYTEKMNQQLNYGDKLTTHLKAELYAHLEARKITDYATKELLPDQQHIQRLQEQTQTEFKTLEIQPQQLIQELQLTNRCSQQQAQFLAHYQLTFEQMHGRQPNDPQNLALNTGALYATESQPRLEKIGEQIHKARNESYDLNNLKYTASSLSCTQGRLVANHSLTCSEPMSAQQLKTLEIHSVAYHNTNNLLAANFTPEKDLQMQNTRQQNQREI